MTDTPFMFHSKALGILEKAKKLTVDSNGEKRKRGTFPPKKPYCNMWKIHFPIEIEIEKENRSKKKGINLFT